MIISLNVDDNAALAETIVRQNGLTMPVLIGGRIYWEKNFPPALPMSWLIDRDGRRSDDPVRVADEASIGRILEELRKITPEPAVVPQLR